MVAQQQMAYPPYFSNNLSLLLGFILPLFLVLSFAFVVPPILKRIVFEKETGVKVYIQNVVMWRIDILSLVLQELMKLMGLPSWMHWVCWFINVILSCTVSILIIVILVSIEFKSGTGAVLAYSDPILTFIFLFLYASSLVCFLFFISTFFDKRNRPAVFTTNFKQFCYSQLGPGPGCSDPHSHLLYTKQHHQQNI